MSYLRRIMYSNLIRQRRLQSLAETEVHNLFFTRFHKCMRVAHFALGSIDLLYISLTLN